MGGKGEGVGYFRISEILGKRVHSLQEAPLRTMLRSENSHKKKRKYSLDQKDSSAMRYTQYT